VFENLFQFPSSAFQIASIRGTCGIGPRLLLNTYYLRFDRLSFLSEKRQG
jgi:hypothetical protein